jgi:hypothetical protein
MATDDGHAPQSILRLRFPDGEVEIRWTDQELPVGVLVRSRGAVWVVKESNEGSVRLEPAPSEVQAQHGPVVKPDALGGEDSVFLETIVEV